MIHKNRWIVDLSMLTSVGMRQLREDPALLLLQATRRLPLRIRSKYIPQHYQGRLGAWCAHLSGHPEKAKLLLSKSGKSAGVLASQLGIEPDPKDRKNQARVAAATGELTQACSLVPETPIAARAASELRILSPRFKLRDLPHSQLPQSATTTRVAMLLTNSLPHTQSGYTQRSAALLRELKQQGIHVEAWTRLGWPATVGKIGVQDTDIIDGVSYHRLRSTSFPHLLDQRLQKQAELWKQEIDKYQPNILHTTTEYPNALVTQAVAKATGLPWVYEMRGQLELSWIASRPSAWKERAANSEKFRLWRNKEVELANNADAVVVLSKVQADDLIERGLEAAKIHIIPNAVDTVLLTETSDSPDLARSKLGLPTEGIWVGSVSSLVAYEGFDVLLKAVALARSQGHDIRCALVGDGVSRPELLALGKELGLGEALIMPGKVNRSVASNWFSALDIFAVPRRDTPVCRMITPMKPLEAMAIGRPVIASDLPALAEIVGAAGILVEPDNIAAYADTIIELASSPKKLTAISITARQLASQRTWYVDAINLGKLYRSLLFQ